MSKLFVYHVSSPQVPDKILTHLEDIASTLAEHGVRVSALEAASPVRPGTDPREVVETLRVDVDRLKGEPAHDEVEVISVDGGEEAATPLQERRLATPHRLWIIAGQGLLSLHIGDYVYAILCERHDLISVPAGVGHWFDLGEHPRLCALRMHACSQQQSAPTADDDFALRFARLDDLT